MAVFMSPSYRICLLVEVSYLARHHHNQLGRIQIDILYSGISLCTVESLRRYCLQGFITLFYFILEIRDFLQIYSFVCFSPIKCH